MKKHTKDETSPVSTFDVPDNVLGEVAKIFSRADQTYPDHGESRADMIRQELINALSKVTLERDRLMEVACEAAHQMEPILQRLTFPLAD